MEYIISQESNRIMVVDDEQVIRDVLSDFFTSENFVVESVSNGEDALKELESKHYDLVLTDMKMPGLSGIDLLRQIKERKLDTLVIIMTGFGTVDTAVEAMKMGAFDYINKPFKLDELIQVIRRAMNQQRLERENIRLKEVMNLYELSEAVNQSLNLENVLRVIADTAIKELGADQVSILLEQPEEFETRLTEQFVYPDTDDSIQDGFGSIDQDQLLKRLENKPYFIVPGAQARKFFKKLPERRSLACLLSVPLRIKEQIVGTVNVYSYRQNYRFSEGQAKLLVILADRAAQAIENARLYQNLRRTFRETIEGLVSALEAKDKYTSGHSRRVTEYALLLARALKLKPEEQEKIEWAGLLHDIGKIGIRLESLNKPGKITKQEHEMFKDHTTMGKQIIEQIHFLSEIVPLVYHHHENYDGTGYPAGLKADHIPLGARILAIADAYDAMTSDRPYRKALEQKDAIKELRRCAGMQFDPQLVEVFCRELELNQKEVVQKKKEWDGISYPPPEF
jgi:putative nucleotidyltransferase with HDIG domain